MSDAGTLMSMSTLTALAVSHIWQSVAVAATLAGILILGRRMSGAARYGLACAGMAAAIVLPLAMFAPGAGARAMLLDLLKAPVAAPTASSTTPQPIELAVAQSALDNARSQVDANPNANAADQAGTGVARFALGVARAGLASERANQASGHANLDRAWGKPIVAAPASGPVKRAAPLFDFQMPKLPDLTLPLLAIWLAGSLVLLVRVARDVLAAEQLVKRARTIPLPVELAQRLGRVRLAISPDAPGPMAAGLFRPCVILPEIAIQRIGTAEMAALLEHELAHIERRDVLAALAQRILIALLWWSPALYWISRRIDEEREAACDETAVARTGDARAFARSLTSQAEIQLWARAPKLAVGAIGRRSQFSRRIRRLVEMAKAGGVPAHYSGRLAFTGLALAIALAAFVTPKLAIADVPKAPPSVDSTLKGKPMQLTLSAQQDRAQQDRNAAEADSHRLAGAARDDVRSDDADDADDADDNDHDDIDADAGDLADLGVQLASLGAQIGLTVSQQVVAQVPDILEQVRDQLREQGVDVDNDNHLTDAQREKIRDDMRRVRDELKTKFGPEYREKIRSEVERAQRDVERAQREIDRHHAEWDSNSDQRRQAMAVAHAAIEKAHKEIEAARARGDFNFNFDFSDFDKFADIDWSSKGPQHVTVKFNENSTDRQLMEAAAGGDVGRVRDLIKAGASVNRAFPGDGSALIAAARAGRVDVVRVLLDAGAGIDKSVHGDGNALIAAAGRGRIDVVRLLLARGADVDGYVPGDETALITAAREGELAVVKLLVEHKANVNLAYRVMGRLRSPLGMAQSRGYDDVAAYLRAHGAVADPKAAD
ncbi:MAG: M56 family metallopeptidase [Alphaproteobacteria bacterium]